MGEKNAAVKRSSAAATISDNGDTNARFVATVEDEEVRVTSSRFVVINVDDGTAIPTNSDPWRPRDNSGSGDQSEDPSQSSQSTQSDNSPTNFYENNRRTRTPDFVERVRNGRAETPDFLDQTRSGATTPDGRSRAESMESLNGRGRENHLDPGSPMRWKRTNGSINDLSGYEREDGFWKYWRHKLAAVAANEIGYILVVVTIAAFLVGMIVFARYRFPDSSFEGSSMTCWFLFFLVFTVLSPISRILIAIIPHIVNRFAEQDRTVYYLRSMRRPLSRLTLSILVTAAFFTIHAIHPFTHEGAESPSQIIHDEVPPKLGALWILMAFGFTCKAYFVASIALKRRTNAYYAQTSEAVVNQKLLTQLTRTIPVRAFVHRKKTPTPWSKVARTVTSTKPEGESRQTRNIIHRVIRNFKRKRQNGAEQAVSQSGGDPNDVAQPYGGPGQPNFGLNPEKKVSFNLENALSNLEIIEKKLKVCRGAKEIKNKKDARLLGRVLWDVYAETTADTPEEIFNISHLPLSQTLDAKGHNPWVTHARKFFHGVTSCAALQRKCEHLFMERRNLSQTLIDVDSIIHTLSRFLTAFLFGLGLLAVLVLFSSGESSDIMVALGTTLFAVSFVFAETCKNSFNSFMFLFFRNPFDIGDRVVVEGSAQPLYVQRMALMTTTFKIWDGTIISIPNHILYHKEIKNHTRSGGMWDFMTMEVMLSTPIAQIQKIEDSFFKCMDAYPLEFDRSQSFFFTSGISQKNVVGIEMYPAHRTNWHNAEFMQRRHYITLALMETCVQEGISYSFPRQPTHISLASDTKDVFSRLSGEPSA